MIFVVWGVSSKENAQCFDDVATMYPLRSSFWPSSSVWGEMLLFDYWGAGQPVLVLSVKLVSRPCFVRRRSRHSRIMRRAWPLTRSALHYRGWTILSRVSNTSSLVFLGKTPVDHGLNVCWVERFDLKKEVVTGGWRKFHSYVCTLYLICYWENEERLDLASWPTR
jgi:hypothetical protein